MFKTTRNISCALAVLAVAAPAASATTQQYKASITAGQLSTAKGYPNPGGTAVLSGVVKTDRFGAGSFVDHVLITGVQQPNVIGFWGSEVDYFARGTMRNTFKGTATIDGDGTQHVVINGIFRGGTGRYRRAGGRYRFEGTTPPGSTVMTGKSKGKVAF